MRLKSKISPIDLAVFKNRFAAICEEMGVALCRSSFSPNIKERQDFSCALFDPQGRVVAQAAHIPVHLGSMPLSVQEAIRSFSLRPGDSVILNDPYRGGTHLPDITLVTPVFFKKNSKPSFYVASRAHHADVGGKSPGSMPLALTLEDEGFVIPPTLFEKRGRLNQIFFKNFLSQVRGPRDRKADLFAQRAANQRGLHGLKELVQQYGLNKTLVAMHSYQAYEDRITRLALRKIPRGRYTFSDVLDDDGIAPDPIKISVTLIVKTNGITADFSQSDPQCAGPLNATFAITLSALAYVFRCLVVSLTGEDCLSLKLIRLKTKKGTVVDARSPAPVAGGNVETSQRIVDVLLGALAQALPQFIPAASQGTMNNIAIGNEDFTYYETIAGGMGARPTAPGESAIHSHMTNTLNTPIEALENDLPLRITRYQIRRNSRGAGNFSGGEGLIREFEFLKPCQVSILSDRRKTAPYGLFGGKPGKQGDNWLRRPTHRHAEPLKKIHLPAKVEIRVNKGDILYIKTPGGGGYGKKP